MNGAHLCSHRSVQGHGLHCQTSCAFAGRPRRSSSTCKFCGVALISQDPASCSFTTQEKLSMIVLNYFIAWCRCCCFGKRCLRCSACASAVHGARTFSGCCISLKCANGSRCWQQSYCTLLIAGDHALPGCVYKMPQTSYGVTVQKCRGAPQGGELGEVFFCFNVRLDTLGASS